MNNTEASYIVALDPPLNYNLPPNDIYWSAGSIRTRSMETLKNAIDRATDIIGPSLKMNNGLDVKYFKKEDIDKAVARVAESIEVSLSDLDAWMTGGNDE
jgi:hypothetical protein